MVTIQQSSPKKAINVAKYFIKKNTEDGKGLDKLKLQKLLYYAQAWNLVLNKEPLFSERIEAWVHGPVVPEVYQEFKNFDFINLKEGFITESDLNQFSKEEKNVLDNVWELYGKYDGPYLEFLTHNESPWQEARNELSSDKPSRATISLESMMDYYSKKLHDSKAI